MRIHSVSLVSVSIPAPIPYSLNYCSLKISPDTWTGTQVPPLFFFRSVPPVLAFVFFHINFKSSNQVLQNTLLGFWLKLYWIYRSTQGRMPFHNIVSPYPSTWPLSPLFRSYWVSLNKVCNFSFTDIVRPLLYLFLDTWRSDIILSSLW